jgi:hypothetical protein
MKTFVRNPRRMGGVSSRYGVSASL